MPKTPNADCSRKLLCPWLLQGALLPPSLLPSPVPPSAPGSCSLCSSWSCSISPTQPHHRSSSPAAPSVQCPLLSQSLLQSVMHQLQHPLLLGAWFCVHRGEGGCRAALLMPLAWQLSLLLSGSLCLLAWAEGLLARQG